METVQFNENLKLFLELPFNALVGIALVPRLRTVVKFSSLFYFLSLLTWIQAIRILLYFLLPISSVATQVKVPYEELTTSLICQIFIYGFANLQKLYK